VVQPAAAPTPPVPVAAVRVASLPGDVRPAGSTANLSTDKRCLGTGFIQVGAFAEPERAVRLAKELDATMVWPVSAELPVADRYARVRLGPLGDRRQAEAALQHLRAIGYANAYLIKPDVTSSLAC
jgi:cell division septation protein DedD